MKPRYILLPSRDFTKIRLVQAPEDFSQRDALRHATSLIGEVQENDPDCSWEDIAAVLEDHGFTPVDFMTGPELD